MRKIRIKKQKSGSNRSALLLFGFQLYHNYLRTVVHPERENAVAEPSADIHIGPSARIKSAVVFRKQTLVRCNHTTDHRQSELTAVSVTAQSKVYAVLHINLKQFRSVRQKNREAFFIAKSLELSSSMLRFLRKGSKGKIGVVYSDYIYMRSALFERYAAVPKDGDSRRKKPFFEVGNSSMRDSWLPVT